ncbi:glucoamylase family protein [Flavobacterium sp.]|uniref:glucoamylase family protein n=1 Tax=Flavobacterium sp. TaxID=239 RepID=UPI003750DAEF
MYPVNIKFFLALSILLTLYISCTVKPQIKKDDKLFDTHFLTKKDYLSLDTHRLDELTDDQFLERIQYDYTKNCLIDKDSIAVVENDGYRINLFCIAIKNEWTSRQRGAKEVLQYLKEYQNAKTVQGIFPRSFNRITGEKIKGLRYGNFGQPYDVVGTAFFATSIQFTIRQFFDKDNPVENDIRKLCNSICNRINWNFAYNTDRKCFTWFKNGEEGKQFDGKDLVGEMDETFFLQLLVLGSKNWNYGTEAYNNYVSKIFVDEQYGYRYFSTKQYDYKNSEQFTGITVNNPEILKLDNYPTAKLGYLVQSHIWFDLKGYRDSICNINNMDYFEGTQNAIKAQIKYAEINPGKNKLYGDVWGFYDTYSPISKKWMVTGLPAEGDTDEGTISISAVMSAIPFAPKESIKCLRTLYNEFKDKGIYGAAGFVMSVNTNSGKLATKPDSFFEPISVLSIENYRSGLLWNLSKKAPEYEILINKAGLKPTIL